MEDYVGSTTLVPPQRLKELGQKSDLKGWTQVLSHLGILAVSTLLLFVTWGSFWSIPLFVIQGVLLNFLYAGAHELSHWTVFKTRGLNDFFGRVLGFLIFVPRDSDRFEHFQHHRHTQNRALDGELQGRPAYTMRTYIFLLSGIGYWKEYFKLIFVDSIRAETAEYLSEPQKARVLKETRIMFALYGMLALLSIFLNSWILIQLWIGPLLTTKVLHNFQNITEHTGMPYVPEILENTRTIKANALIKWLAWNMPYHTAHHVYPAIPFHSLPELHEDIVQGLGREPETISYLHFQVQMFKKLVKDGHSDYSGQPIANY